MARLEIVRAVSGGVRIALIAQVSDLKKRVVGILWAYVSIAVNDAVPGVVARDEGTPRKPSVIHQLDGKIGFSGVGKRHSGCVTPDCESAVREFLQANLAVKLFGILQNFLGSEKLLVGPTTIV